jgi:hypothetical protein
MGSLFLDYSHCRRQEGATQTVNFSQKEGTMKADCGFTREGTNERTRQSIYEGRHEETLRQLPSSGKHEGSLIFDGKSERKYVISHEREGTKDDTII